MLYLPVISSLLFLVQFTQAGRVGECRTECVERNTQKIVRVHLKEDWVMVGTCINATETDIADAKENGDAPFKSFVYPYICDRKVGIWTLDELDEEGIAKFNVLCPSVDGVEQGLIDACPK